MVLNVILKQENILVPFNPNFLPNNNKLIKFNKGNKSISVNIKTKLLFQNVQCEKQAVEVIIEILKSKKLPLKLFL